MLIKSLYEKYNLLPSLQDHLITVAAAVYVVSTHCGLTKNDLNTVVTAALVHDFGNLVKFDLTLYPHFFEPQGVDYWAKIQQQWKKRYGEDSRKATIAVLHEFCTDQNILRLIPLVGFSQAEKVFTDNDLLAEILCYCDQRVSPTGLVSLQERIEDGKSRFTANHKVSLTDERYKTASETNTRALFHIEKFLSKMYPKIRSLTDWDLHVAREVVSTWSIEADIVRQV